MLALEVRGCRGDGRLVERPVLAAAEAQFERGSDCLPSSSVEEEAPQGFCSLQGGAQGSFRKSLW